MVRIIKGRYGYAADDGTVQIAEPGKELSLDPKEEARLIRLGSAEAVENEEKKAGEVNEPEPETPKPRRRKGRKS